MRLMLTITGALLIALPVAAQQQDNPRSRFAGMDRDQDGVITRTEWRGSAQSFDKHDWNNDGVLSGDELRPGAYRRGSREEPDFDAGDNGFAD